MLTLSIIHNPAFTVAAAFWAAALVVAAVLDLERLTKGGGQG